MKKTKLFLLLGLCLPLLFACGDDDNNTTNKGNDPSGDADKAKTELIIGKWCTTTIDGL